MRTSIYRVPTKPTHCPKERCVYNEAGVCADPRTHKGNSDALCFRMNNKDVLKMLAPPDRENDHA